MTGPLVLRDGYRWASVGAQYDVGTAASTHVVRKGAVTSVCGTTALPATLWRANTTKPQCSECVTRERARERAEEAFRPPVVSRDVDAQPRFRNDSPRWTDWGYPPRQALPEAAPPAPCGSCDHGQHRAHECPALVPTAEGNRAMCPCTTQAPELYVHHIAGGAGALLLPLLCCGRTIGTDLGATTVHVDARHVTCPGPPASTVDVRECRYCGADVEVVDARQAEHVHQYGDKRCRASGQERTDVVRAQAPDVAQETLRAAAGFPWCDTCHAPAVGGDRPPMHADLATDSNGQIHALPRYGVSETHPVTTRQWWDAQ